MSAHFDEIKEASSSSFTWPALLHRDGDAWRFVDSRPYAFASNPG